MNKKYILKANHEIEALLAKKHSVGSKYYVLYFERTDEVKIAVSVSKKLGNAVVRNYQKRVTKEILREFLEDYQGYSFLLVCKIPSLDLDFENKKKQIQYVLNKMKDFKA